MSPFRRNLIAILLLLPLRARAHGNGQEYNLLQPEQPVETTGKVEVVEFFWYGCPHCYQFEPLLEAWLPKLPADVAFRRIPAIFNDRWAQDAAIYYAFDALGLTEKLHRPLFDAIHRDRLRTDVSKALGEWLRKQGVDPVRFEQVLKSFGVQSRLSRARQLSVSYKLEGVPTLAVQGRYTIETERGFEAMLKTADKLIVEARKGVAARR